MLFVSVGATSATVPIKLAHLPVPFTRPGFDNKNDDNDDDCPPSWTTASTTS